MTNITFPFKLFMFHSIICKYDDVIVMDVQTVRYFSGYKLKIVRHVCNCGFHSYVYCLAQYQNVCIYCPLGSFHTKRRKKSFDVHRNYCGCSCWIISSLCTSDVFFAWCKSTVKHNETRKERERVVLLSTSNNLI